MAAETQIVPAHIAQKLFAFINKGKTGKMVINIKEGRVMGAEITEHIRLDKNK